METQLVELWNRARSRGENVYLATVIHVEGSSYRKLGARMLVTSGGERTGTISGGCLEAEVARKIAWLTRNGTYLKSYRSSFDNDNDGVPYGLGCGGTIWVLMEAGNSVDAVMRALRRSLEQRAKAVVIMSLSKDGAALAVEFVFGALHLIPEERKVQFVEASIRWNYTTVLNIVFLLLALALVVRFLRNGGPAMLRSMMSGASHQGMEHAMGAHSEHLH